MATKEDFEKIRTELNILKYAIRVAIKSERNIGDILDEMSNWYGNINGEEFADDYQ